MVGLLMTGLLMLSGCVTPRSIDEVKQEIREVKAQTSDTQARIQSMDSTMTASAEADRQLRTNVQVTVDELQRQIDQLLENYNELMALLQQVKNQPQVIKLPPTSSPGAQTESNLPEPPENKPAIDCQATYDEGFIEFRRSEYDKAISTFQLFLDNCPNSEVVENAHYWMGEAYYAKESYDDAIQQFQIIVDKYKNSINYGQAMYKLARSYEELGKKAEAKKYYQQLTKDQPGTLEAQQAAERLKSM
jgi:tol-pal system protein YbgF